MFKSRPDPMLHAPPAQLSVSVLYMKTMTNKGPTHCKSLKEKKIIKIIFFRGLVPRKNTTLKSDNLELESSNNLAHDKYPFFSLENYMGLAQNSGFKLI